MNNKTVIGPKLKAKLKELTAQEKNPNRDMRHEGATSHYRNILPNKGDSKFMADLKQKERERLEKSSNVLTDEDFWP